MVTLEQTLSLTHDWVIDRMHQLCDEGYERVEDAHAIRLEFDEWLDPNIPDHNVYSLEYIGEGSDY